MPATRDLKGCKSATDDSDGRRHILASVVKLMPHVCKLAGLDCLACPLSVCIHDLGQGSMAGKIPGQGLLCSVTAARRRAVRASRDPVAACRQSLIDWYNARQAAPSMVRARRRLDAIPEGPHHGVAFTGSTASGAEATPTW